MEQTGHRDSVTHLDKIADHHCTYHYNDLMTTYLKSLASRVVVGDWCLEGGCHQGQDQEAGG